MEHIENTENTIDVFENDIQMYISMFCEEYHIEDIKEISQSVYNALLKYVYKHCFKGTDKLKSKALYKTSEYIRSNYNAYDIDLCYQLCEYYIYISQLYEKEISIVGFSNLSGIEENTIYSWGKEDQRKTLSTKSCDIYKMLNKGRENSLSDKLSSGKGNPVGILAILNHNFNWAGVGNMEERKPEKISLSEVRKSAVELSDNSGQAALQIAEKQENKLSDN